MQHYTSRSLSKKSTSLFSSLHLHQARQSVATLALPFVVLSPSVWSTKQSDLPSQPLSPIAVDTRQVTSCHCCLTVCRRCLPSPPYQSPSPQTLVTFKIHFKSLSTTLNLDHLLLFLFFLFQHFFENQNILFGFWTIYLLKYRIGMKNPHPICQSWIGRLDTDPQLQFADPTNPTFSDQSDSWVGFESYGSVRDLTFPILNAR